MNMEASEIILKYIKEVHGTQIKAADKYKITRATLSLKIKSGHPLYLDLAQTYFELEDTKKELEKYKRYMRSFRNPTRDE